MPVRLGLSEVVSPVLTHQEQALKPPARYQVLMLNDDFTPMDFVVDVLQIYFHLSIDEALKVMMVVHKQGEAVCGTYSKDIAQTKVSQVIDHARSEEYPLMCQIKKIEE
jgi:ATP-dependent Clp protease adaptor protein ClpS